MADETRRYSDEEFALVVRKAIELEREGASSSAMTEAGTRRGGLSLEDMKGIAAEAGLDPNAVERAALLLAQRATSRADRLLGGPTRFRREQTIAGALPVERYPHVLDAIRQATDHHGEVSPEVGSLAWKSVGELSQVYVTVTPGEDSTELRVTANRDPAFILTWFFSVGGAMVLGGISGAIFEPSTVAGGVGLFASLATGGLALARTLWGRGTRRFEHRLDAVMEALRKSVSNATEPEEEG